MKPRILISMAGGLAVFLLAGNLSSAGTINQTEWRQQERIWHGYRSGELTPREFRRLEREQAFIRRSEAHKETPVLIISTQSSERDRARGLSLGANGYLSKPFSPADLQNEVWRFLATDPKPHG